MQTNQLREFISTMRGIKNITFIYTHVRVHNLPLLRKSRRNQGTSVKGKCKEELPMTKRLARGTLTVLKSLLEESKPRSPRCDAAGSWLLPGQILLPWELTGKLLALKGQNIHPAPGRIPLLLAARVHGLCKQPLAIPTTRFSRTTTTHKTCVQLQVLLLQECCNLFICTTVGQTELGHW